MRKKYIDFLRLLALFYMFFQHSMLVFLNPDQYNGFLFFLFELVPICPALFLFISGFSLTMYFEKNNIRLIENKYFFHLLKRGFLLIICGSILFFIEHGFQLWDIFISSSILNTIGIMIIISALILKTPYKKTFSIVITLFFVIITYILENNNIEFFPINIGYEPWSPTIIFGFLGLVIGLLYDYFKKHKNIYVIILGITGFFITIFYFIKFGPFKIFFTDTGRYTVTRIFNEALQPQNIINFLNSKKIIYEASIWNYNFDCFIASFGIVLILFASGYLIENILQKYLPENVFIPGKFAFFNYFYHLAIIGIMVLILGFGFMNKLNLFIFLLILFISSYIFSFLIYYVKKRKLLFKKRV